MAEGIHRVYTDNVTLCISFCRDVCVPTRSWVIYNSSTPWFTAELMKLHREIKEAYMSGDKNIFKTAFVKVKAEKGRRADKQRFPEKLKNRLSAIDRRSQTPAWTTSFLVNDLNTFYCRCDGSQLKPHSPSCIIRTSPSLPPLPDRQNQQ